MQHTINLLQKRAQSSGVPGILQMCMHIFILFCVCAWILNIALPVG